MDSAALRQLAEEQDLRQRHRLRSAARSFRVRASSGDMARQAFELALRQADLNEDILRTIDHAIPFPILFERHFAGKGWKRMNYEG